MTLVDIAKQFERYAVENSPTLLTGIGAAGVVVTAYLTGHAAYQVGKDVNAGHYEPLMEGREPEYYDTKDLIKTYWMDFVPAVAMGSLSVAAIIGANRIGARRAAAVAAAYSLSEKAYSEYREKVQEKMGEKKHQSMRDEIAQKRVDNDPVSSKEIVITGTGEVMCYDSLTGRYFLSSMETIRGAENEINRRILNSIGSYASLTDFYDLLGLQGTSFSERVGWNSDRMLKVSFSTVISDDGRPCLSIEYDELPLTGYFRQY
jgi:Family of unknown function (DUF6353)